MTCDASMTGRSGRGPPTSLRSQTCGPIWMLPMRPAPPNRHAVHQTTREHPRARLTCHRACRSAAVTSCAMANPHFSAKRAWPGNGGRHVSVKMQTGSNTRHRRRRYASTIEETPRISSASSSRALPFSSRSLNMSGLWAPSEFSAAAKFQ